MTLCGIESYFFKDDREKDISINTVINSRLEFGFIYYISQQLHDTPPYIEEIDYCLEKYSECIKKGYNNYDAKRKALLGGMENIYKRQTYPIQSFNDSDEDE